MDGFPAWFYHREHGARKFKDPEELAAAGKGWHDSPATVGLESSVPQGVNGPMNFKAIEQPLDESVATADEVVKATAKRAKKPAVEPTSVASRRRATSKR